MPNGPDTNTSSSVSLSYALNPTPAPIHIRADPNLVVGDASGKLMMLSEVGNNQPVHCRLGGEFLTASNYQLNDTQPAWTLIKHGGSLYVRGWIPRMSSKVFLTEGTFVENSKNSQCPVAVTMSINDFNVAPCTSGAEEEEATFYATDVRLDQHAYEKW